MSDLKYELLKVDLIMVGYMLFGFYCIYIVWKENAPIKWLRIVGKLTSIIILVLAIYVAQGPIRDTIDFQPIEKEITVKLEGSAIFSGLFYATVSDMNEETYYIYGLSTINRGDRLKIIYVPHSNVVLKYKKIGEVDLD